MAVFRDKPMSDCPFVLEMTVFRDKPVSECLFVLKMTVFRDKVYTNCLGGSFAGEYACQRFETSCAS